MHSISILAPMASPATATVERAGRWPPEEGGVSLVHGLEIGHVGEEYQALDDPLLGKTGGMKRLFPMRERLARLGGDPAFDQAERAGSPPVVKVSRLGDIADSALL